MHISLVGDIDIQNRHVHSQRETEKYREKDTEKQR